MLATLESLKRKMRASVAEGGGKTFGMDGDMCGDGGSQVGIFKEGDVVAGGFQATMVVKKSSEE